ncbi:hypothetical protein [Cupriavidus basilensis]|uniref:hypothetical protein n=1 Tax=Cupriavidus basilensis TaxID=68895 RepID=UPI00157B58E2|nr:hypothetical protein [Cupriavidus basilensis]
MLEFNGYKIPYEVQSLPKGNWAIVIEIMRTRNGAPDGGFFTMTPQSGCNARRDPP